MRFHNIYPPEFGGYAQPDPYSYYGQMDPTYGYYGQIDPTYGYYSQVDPTYGYYEQVDPAYGYYGQADPAYGYSDPSYGYYGDVYPAYGYYGEDPASQAWDGYNSYGQYEPAGYPQSEPVGYYAEEYPVGNYGQVPEMVGYGQPEPQYPEIHPNESYAGPDYSGYVRAVPSPFNAGCPFPTNVNGFDDGGFDGFVRPTTVNPTCGQFTEQPGSPSAAPDTFKPLW